MKLRFGIDIHYTELNCLVTFGTHLCGVGPQGRCILLVLGGDGGGDTLTLIAAMVLLGNKANAFCVVLLYCIIQYSNQ